MKNLIITGASGHVGNNVLNILCKNKKYNIKLLLLPKEDISYLKDYNCEIAYGDIRNKEFLNKEITQGSIVIHMAGIIDISSGKKDVMYDVNVNGTKNLVDECILKKCEKFIYTSSVHAIAEKKHHGVMNEQAKFDERKVVGDYAKSKCMATRYVFEKISQGLNGVVVYPSGIFGPNDYKCSNTGKLVVDIANQDIKVRINGSYNFVDVRDVANGVILAMEKGEIGEGYILSGQVVTIDEIFTAVKKNLGMKKYVPKIATWFVKMFASLAEFYYKVRKQKPLFSKYSLYTLTSNHNFSNDKAKQKLGWNTRSFDETIKDTLKWFIVNKKELFKKETIEAYNEYQKKII